MLNRLAAREDWRACLARGGIAVALTSVDGPVTAARDAGRRNCEALQQLHPGHFVSRSATAGMSAIALSRTHRVGIDIERIDPGVQLDAGLLSAALHPDELAAMASRETAAFLRLWTCKEAALKAAGAGLALRPATVPVGWETGDWTRVDFGSRASAASVRSLACAPGFAAAIATLGVPRDVRIVKHFTPA